MSKSRSIAALAFTNSHAQHYSNGAKFNVEAATRIFSFLCDPNWKEKLKANPLALFYTWGKLADEPICISERQGRSKLLAYSLWMCELDDDVYYPCLCTDSEGMVKGGYWRSLKWMGEFCEVNDVDPQTEEEAVAILQTHRRTLFSKFFEPADVEFIMATIPCTTTL